MKTFFLSYAFLCTQNLLAMENIIEEKFIFPKPGQSYQDYIGKEKPNYFVVGSSEVKKFNTNEKRKEGLWYFFHAIETNNPGLNPWHIIKNIEFETKMDKEISKIAKQREGLKKICDFLPKLQYNEKEAFSEILNVSKKKNYQEILNHQYTDQFFKKFKYEEVKKALYNKNLNPKIVSLREYRGLLLFMQKKDLEFNLRLMVYFNNYYYNFIKQVQEHLHITKEILEWKNRCYRAFLNKTKDKKEREPVFVSIIESFKTFLEKTDIKELNSIDSYNNISFLESYKEFKPLISMISKELKQATNLFIKNKNLKTKPETIYNAETLNILCTIEEFLEIFYNKAVDQNLFDWINKNFPTNLLQISNIEIILNMLHTENEKFFIPLFLLEKLPHSNFKNLYPIINYIESMFNPKNNDEHERTFLILDFIERNIKEKNFSDFVLSTAVHFFIKGAKNSSQDLLQLEKESFKYLENYLKNSNIKVEEIFEDLYDKGLKDKNKETKIKFLEKTFDVLLPLLSTSPENENYRMTMARLYYVTNTLEKMKNNELKSVLIDGELSKIKETYHNKLVYYFLQEGSVKSNIRHKNLLRRTETERVRIPTITKHSKLTFNENFWDFNSVYDPVQNIDYEKLTQKINAINTTNNLDCKIGENLKPYLKNNTQDLTSCKVRQMINHSLEKNLVDFLIYFLSNTLTCQTGVIYAVDVFYKEFLKDGNKPFYKTNIILPKNVESPEKISELQVDVEKTLEGKNNRWNHFIEELKIFIQQHIIDARSSELSVLKPWFPMDPKNIPQPSHSNIFLRSLMSDILKDPEGVKFDLQNHYQLDWLDKNRKIKIFDQFFQKGYIPYVLKQTEKFLEQTPQNIREFIFNQILNIKNPEMIYVIHNQKNNTTVKQFTTKETSQITDLIDLSGLESYFDEDFNLKEKDHTLKSNMAITEEIVVDFLRAIDVFVPFKR